MRISDWSSDVCSSDLRPRRRRAAASSCAGLLQRALERAVVRIELARLLEVLARFVAVAGPPQHFGQVGADLGVLLPRERAPQLAPRFLVAAAPVHPPAVASYARRVARVRDAGAFARRARFRLAGGGGG